MMQRAKKQFDACQKPLDKYTYLMALQVHLPGVYFFGAFNTLSLAGLFALDP